MDVLTIEPHYSVAKVAQLLDVSRHWVYRRIREGAFSVVELGGNERSNQRIAASELQRFLDANTYGNKKPGAATPGQNINN